MVVGLDQNPNALVVVGTQEYISTRIHTDSHQVLPTADDGTLCLDAIRGSLKADDPHFCVTKLVTLENTHNLADAIVPDSATATRIRRNDLLVAHDVELLLHRTRR